MGTAFAWVARGWWLLYLLAGVVWVILGAAVLGDPQGLGLIFIGLACLAFGVYGACKIGRSRRVTRRTITDDD